MSRRGTESRGRPRPREDDSRSAGSWLWRWERPLSDSRPLYSLADRPASVIIAVMLFFVGYGVGAVLVQLLGLQGSLRSVGAVVDPTITPEFLGGLVRLLVVAELGFPLVAVVFLYWRGNSRRVLGYGLPGRRALLATAGGGVGLVGVNLVVLAGVGLFETSGLALGDGLTATTVVLALGAVMFLVVAPAEEFLFRGVIQRYLMGPFTRRNAVLVTATLFSVAHVGNAGLSASPRVILFADFLGGLVLGWLYEYTDNLFVPTFVHGAYNTTLLSVVLL